MKWSAKLEMNRIFNSNVSNQSHWLEFQYIYGFQFLLYPFNKPRQIRRDDTIVIKSFFFASSSL